MRTKQSPQPHTYEPLTKEEWVEWFFSLSKEAQEKIRRCKPIFYRIRIAGAVEGK